MSALKDQTTPKTIRMKQADLNKWLAALRSGNYKQGSEYLHNETNGTYCCLGVLQAALDGGVEYDKKHNKGDQLPSMSWLDAHGIEFFGSLGIPQRSPYLLSLMSTADDANDDIVFPTGGGEGQHTYNFNVIAYAIEAAAETY